MSSEVSFNCRYTAVLTYCQFLEKNHGYRVTYLPVDRGGLLSLADLENAFTPETALVSLMWANNETGVLFPVKDIAEFCRSHGVPYHCDAVQAAGKLPIDVRSIPFDYLSITGHKIGAPKGIGVLYIHRKARFTPFVHGGHQELSRRGGTENVPYLIGLGKAANDAANSFPAYERTVRPLRDALEQSILTTIPATELNGSPAHRLANTTNITFLGTESEALLLLLDQAGICASSGSACLADSPDPSHVIAAMKPGEAAHQSIRFSLGFKTSAQEIASATAAIQKSVAQLGGGL